MRPLGINLIGISIYILNMIHFMMILVNFGVFSLMLTDIRTDTTPYRDAKSHLNKSNRTTMRPLGIYFIGISIQWHPAIPDVKGPTNFICYWRIFVIANIGN